MAGLQEVAKAVEASEAARAAAAAAAAAEGQGGRLSQRPSLQDIHGAGGLSFREQELGAAGATAQWAWQVRPAGRLTGQQRGGSLLLTRDPQCVVFW